jgi:hypothetical protein
VNKITYSRNYAKEILDSTLFVTNNSKHVHISDESIDSYCEKIIPNILKNKDWIEKSPFDLSLLDEKNKTHLLVAFNSLSFSYWDTPYWQVTHNNTTHTRGTWSLIESLLRAEEEGINILNPTIQANLTKSDLAHILRGNITIPLLDERLNIINQVGKIIVTKYDKDFRNMISNINTAPELLNEIITNIPSFKDEAKYDGQIISFYKRAQALVESLAPIFNLSHLDELTALADYILPRKLEEEGILKYDSDLSNKIRNQELIPAKSTYEIEIRANTIWAVEKLKHKLHSKNIILNSKEINDYLWITGNDCKTNHHRTRTTSY